MNSEIQCYSIRLFWGRPPECHPIPTEDDPHESFEREVESYFGKSDKFLVSQNIKLSKDFRSINKIWLYEHQSLKFPSCKFILGWIENQNVSGESFCSNVWFSLSMRKKQSSRMFIISLKINCLVFSLPDFGYLK